MIDLTPLDVRKKKGDFRRGMRGYETGVVDDFLDVVADRMDELVRENMALTERIARLEEQVHETRDRERALTDALVTAQEMREDMRQQTLREADLARREAESQAARILRDAANSVEREQETLRQLRARQRQVVASYRAFLERELAELSVTAEGLDHPDRGDSAAGQHTPPDRAHRSASPAARSTPAVQPPGRAPAQPAARGREGASAAAGAPGATPHAATPDAATPRTATPHAATPDAAAKDAPPHAAAKDAAAKDAAAKDAPARAAAPPDEFELLKLALEEDT